MGGRIDLDQLSTISASAGMAVIYEPSDDTWSPGFISSSLSASVDKIVFPIWAEEAANLDTTTGPGGIGFQWSYGNGENTPQNSGISIPFDCECFALSLDVNNIITAGEVELYVDGVGTGETVRIENETSGYNTLVSPIAINAGSLINFRTIDATGSSGGNRVAAWFQAFAESISGSNGNISGSVVGGDLSGTLPNPTVVGIQSYPVSSAVPISGNLLVFDGIQYISVPSASVGVTIHNNLTGRDALDAHSQYALTGTEISGGYGLTGGGTLASDFGFGLDYDVFRAREAGGGQSIGTSLTTLNFDNTDYVDSSFSFSDPTLTINEDGLYLIGYKIVLDKTSAAGVQTTGATFALNSITQNRAASFATHASTTNGEGTLQCIVPAQLSAGDEIIVQAITLTGAGTIVNLGSNYCIMWAVRLD